MVAMATIEKASQGSLALADFVHSVAADVAAEVPVKLSVGEAQFELSGDVSIHIFALVELLASGVDVAVNEMPRMLTTGQAADLLGVSRPTVVAIIDRGDLEASRVGSHRRVLATDVLALRARRSTKQSAALDELVGLSEELGLYDE